MHGAISMALLPGSAGQESSIFGEFTVRHPEDKKRRAAVGTVARCFHRSKARHRRSARRTSASGSRSRTANSPSAASDQDDGHYQLLNGTLESADGPYTFGTYLWARFNNLTKWGAQKRSTARTSITWLRSKATIHGSCASSAA